MRLVAIWGGVLMGIGIEQFLPAPQGQHQYWVWWVSGLFLAVYSLLSEDSQEKRGPEKPPAVATRNLPSTKAELK